MLCAQDLAKRSEDGMHVRMLRAWKTTVARAKFIKKKIRGLMRSGAAAVKQHAPPPPPHSDPSALISDPCALIPLPRTGVR